MSKFLFAGLLGLFATLPLFANEAKVEAEINTENKAAGTDEADQVITNRRFRASQGSLSDWSFNSSWTYNGGSIDKPIGSSRPNVTGASDVALVQNLSGNLGVSYRASTFDRFTFGIGLQMASPFS